MSEQAMDLRSTMAVLRRRGRLLMAAGLVGLVAGVSYVVLQPPRLGSTTLVLLPTPLATDEETREVTTQVEIARSANVLAAAGEAVRPALSARAVEARVEVSAPTNQIIRIQAFGTKGKQVRALSQAVADAYVVSLRRTAQAITHSALADLRDREEDLQGQVSALQEEIDATTTRRRDAAQDSPDGRLEAQLMAQLRAEQADISLQLDQVKGDIAAGTPESATSGAGTTVVQPATPARGQSLLRPLLIWAPLGLALGSLLAALVILVAVRKDPALRLRDEIADAVGSSVLAAVRSRPQRSVAGWSSMLKTYLPAPVDAWAFRQVLRELGPVDIPAQGHRGEGRQAGKVDHPRSLTVVSLSGDDRGLAVGPQFAAFTSSLGIVTRLVTAEGHASAASLWAACGSDSRPQGRPNLTIGPGDDDVELTIILTVLDRRAPSLQGALWTAGTLLAVAAASATEEDLARLAVAADDAGRRIDGIVLADPDRSDRTTGRHTMDERARHVSLPMRLTGSRPLELPGDRRTRP